MDADEVIRKTLIEASSLSPLAFCAALRKNLRENNLKVLPREPTDEMVDRWLDLPTGRGRIENATLDWRQMWDAA